MDCKSIVKWRKQFNLSGYASEEQRESFARLSAEVGLERAAKKAGVHISTVVVWRREFGVAGSPSKRYYLPEEKEAALALCDEIGVPKAARQLGMPKETLYAWRRQ